MRSAAPTVLAAILLLLSLAPRAEGARGRPQRRHVVTPGCRALDASTRGLPTPVAPGDEAWYDRRDDPRTRGANEAARDISLAIDPARGALYVHTYRWLVAGGRMVVIVGGSNFEDRVGEWNYPAQEWVREVSRDETGCAVVPVLQIDYRLPGLFGIGEDQMNFLGYELSFRNGVRRAEKMVRKAISAGSRDVWILGHSKGSDIVGNAVARLSRLPELTHGFSFAVPYLEAAGIGIRSLVAPSADAEGRRAGLFKYDRHNGARFRGKLIVFNKASDRVANNVEPWNVGALIDYGHDYVRVLGDPAFRRRLRALVRSRVPSCEDRAAGVTFDE